jgi:betaine-homocysteine S-methyltransferase
MGSASETTGQEGPHETRPLLERLAAGPVICAEGYVFELERRGYLQAGAFVPEVVLDHPEVVAQLHRDFVHAGSDVVEALTYYAHRDKLRVIGREHELEPLNRQALELAGQVARETGTLLAGNISNTNVFTGDDDSARVVRAMFEEQVGWAAEAGADFVIAETISWGTEALIGLEEIKRHGLPAVVTLALHKDPVTFEGWPVAEACRRLEDAGADVVGLNCIRGPRTMLPVLDEIRAAVSCHVAALPVPYRTTEVEPTFSVLSDPGYPDVPGGRHFPLALEPLLCNRYEVAEFTTAAHELGVRYLGLCCGAAPHHIRSMAEALGRTPPASRYSPDMSRHSFYGGEDTVPEAYRDYAKRL